MADIEFVKHHSLTVAKAKGLVQRIADGLGAEYGLTSEWRGNTLHFHRSGVKGEMHVTDSEVRLHVTLGLLLKAFKGTFVEHIERNFDELLAKQSSPPTSKKAGRKDSAVADEKTKKR
jgi:putative polyhydroxyalkanoate system protein